jgi:hypothetical protein
MHAPREGLTRHERHARDYNTQQKEAKIIVQRIERLAFQHSQRKHSTPLGITHRA